jgi:hypothetical protein
VRPRTTAAKHFIAKRAVFLYRSHNLPPPQVPWRPGRKDADSGLTSPPNGRLPDASLGADEVSRVFDRMDFTDEETVGTVLGTGKNIER